MREEQKALQEQAKEGLFGSMLATFDTAHEEDSKNKAQNMTESLKLALNHIFDTNGKRQTLDQLLQSDQAHIWKQATSNKLGRLFLETGSGKI